MVSHWSPPSTVPSFTKSLVVCSLCEYDYYYLLFLLFDVNHGVIITRPLIDLQIQLNAVHLFAFIFFWFSSFLLHVTVYLHASDFERILVGFNINHIVCMMYCALFFFLNQQLWMCTIYCTIFSTTLFAISSVWPSHWIYICLFSNGNVVKFRNCDNRGKSLSTFEMQQVACYKWL